MADHPLLKCPERVRTWTLGSHVLCLPAWLSLVSCESHNQRERERERQREREREASPSTQRKRIGGEGCLVLVETYHDKQGDVRPAHRKVDMGNGTDLRAIRSLVSRAEARSDGHMNLRHPYEQVQINGWVGT